MIDESNQQQADFWSGAGTVWVALRDRFDAQAGAHGEAAIEALRPSAGERIIDVGCGAGSTALELARRVAPSGSVLGLDISETMITGAVELAASVSADNVSFVVADAMSHGFTADADAVFSRFGVMFFSDATAGFSNIRQALVPGGRLGFTCWRSPAENPWMSGALGAAANYVDLPFGNDPTAPGPLSLADPDRIRTVLADAGYVDIEAVAHDAPAMLGSNPADAAGFMSDLMPPIAALGRDDPDAAERLTADLVDLMSAWVTDAGVACPVGDLDRHGAYALTRARWIFRPHDPPTPAVAEWTGGIHTYGRRRRYRTTQDAELHAAPAMPDPPRPDFAGERLGCDRTASSTGPASRRFPLLATVRD